MSCSHRGFLFSLIFALWLMTLTAFCIAQFSVSSSFAETWGCRFWTIQLTMTGLCGFLIIWTAVIGTSLLANAPLSRSLLVAFGIAGVLFHMPNGITTMIDYICGTESASASEYCTYSIMTLVVAILTTLLGVMYAGLLMMLLCCKKEDQCEC